MGRGNTKAWDVIRAYIDTEMTIPTLHNNLTSALGPLFALDQDFWNDVITDVTPDNHDVDVAMVKYNNLRARHVVSLF
jgi:hypothetical protein